MTYDAEHYNSKWKSVIKDMPKGGSYHFDLRQYGHNIVKNYIEEGSSVFDYACGLAVLSAQLEKDKRCKVSGCDLSEVAVNYANDNTNGAFTVGSDIQGDYDYILGLQFLEHIPDPVEWLNLAFKHTDTIICLLPNNFRHAGEHKNMQWSSWGQFQKLFKGFKWERIDKDKYPRGLSESYKHPVIVFTQTKKKEVINDSSINVHAEYPIRKRSKRTRKNAKTL